MDRRYKPQTPQEQLAAREALLETIAAHPEWSVPDVVRHVRTSLRLTHADMARIGKVSVATLRNLESGQTSPTLATLDGVLRPFGLAVSVSVRK